MSKAIRILLLLLCAPLLAAQQGEVSYSDDFQSYGTQKNPDGWVDSSVGTAKPLANGLYKTWPDPLKDANVVYGTKQSSGKPEGNHPRIGTFSTLTTKSFDGGGRFEYRGRFLRTNDDTRVGFTFFSSYPEKDSYYLIGTWGEKLTMQLFGFGAGTLSEKTDSAFTPDAGKWYRFLIQADDANGATRIRARFWLDGTDEPQTYSIDAVDISDTRLKNGRIGIWSAVKGDAYVDDLFAKSPVDHIAPAITFVENNVTLLANTRTVINHDARVEVTATDDLSGVKTLTVTRNGEPYTPMTTIASEGLHTYRARAEDNVGNASESEVRVVVDKTPPVVAINVTSTEFKTNVTPKITVTDITATTILVNGAPWVDGTEFSAEGEYTLNVAVTDEANWTTTLAPIRFVIDKTAPAVRVTESGAAFTGGKFKRDLAPKIEIQDLTKTTIDAKLGGVTWTPDTVIVSEGTQTLAITVTDNLGHATIVPPINFTIDKTAPVVTITESGQPLVTGAAFNRASVKPEIAIQDATTTTTTATLNEQHFTFGTSLTEEGKYTLNVSVGDELEWTTTVPPIEFFIDRTAPAVTLKEGDNALTDGQWFNRDVTPRAVITDTTKTDIAATLNDQPFTLGTTITAEGSYKLVVKVSDAVGLTTELPPVTFHIDKTAPKIVIQSPAASAKLSTPRVVVSGDADDAVTIDVNGVAAVINAKTFVTPSELELLEGENTITASGADRAGNSTTVAIPVHLDTRAPELTVTSPAADACLTATELTVTGRTLDATLQRVNVSIGLTDAEATLTDDRRSFTATIGSLTEGKVVVRVEALDAAGHSSVVTVPVTIDRTKPTVEITEGGAPFTVAAINRAVAPSIRTDIDATITATLNGSAYQSGTQIATEGTYELRATAKDCAGNVSDEAVRRFVIDRTLPAIVNIAPASNATIASKGAITGTLSEPATLIIDGTSIAAVVNGTQFTLSAPLSEGRNAFRLLATDAAGNESRVEYNVTVDTTPPSVEIIVGGSPVRPNAIYSRAVNAEIRASEPNATITATLDQQPFTGGTISADGNHTITARAKDALGNESADVSASFRIDRTAPSIDIKSPANASTINAATVEVSGTVSGDDVTSVRVNEVPATLAGANFTASIPLELGPNLIAATARDAAGNSSTDSIEVTRPGAGSGLLVTSPENGITTNRPTIVVAGQVLTPSAARTVNINGASHPVDITGAFRKIDFALAEGPNTIQVSAGSNSVSVSVTADFTAPLLRLTANNVELTDGARFLSAPALAIEASDDETGVVSTKLTVDGEVVTPGVIPLLDGAHAVTAIATDKAGNETRVDRAFFIGNAIAASGCALSNFDPVDGTAVFADTVRLTGRSGGAAGVLVNNVAASVADGSFCTDVALAPGRNEITIRCADASGQPTNDAAQTLIVYRYADPTITITQPANGATVSASTVTVNGTVGEGVVSGDVNGVAFAVSEGSTFSVPNVPLAAGLNLITARARSKSSRVGIATARVTALTGAPELTITSPLTGTETGATTMDISGTYANVTPSAITATAGGAQQSVVATPHSATSGTFRATVPLPIGASTITVSAASASATAAITQTPGHPAISIASPLDNTYLPSSQSGTIRVSGSFIAAQSAQVQVNGVLATIDGSTFTADIDPPPASTPIVIARVTTADDRTSTDAIRVTRFAEPFAVKSSFPASDATGVERGVLVVVLFDHPLDASSTSSPLRLIDANGATIDGETFADRDAISFAPHQPLQAGARYTVTVPTTLKDLAGASLASAHSFSFTAGGSAPANAPTLDATTTTGCFNGATITGRVSTPNARVRLDVDGVTMTTDASSTGAFRFTFSFSGQTGYHVVRVRELGADGTLSAERAVCYRINCEIPQVLAASLDREAKTLTIQFSKAIDATTATASSIVVTPEGESALTGTIGVNDSIVTLTFASIPAKTIALLVRKSVKDTTGAPMAADYTQTFVLSEDPGLERGKGFVSGAIYDATNGRPLASANVVIGEATLVTNDRGRYARSLAEGAYTIEASKPGYTTVWRQIIVPSGGSVIPIDIRLTKRNTTQTHGAQTTVTKKVELTGASSASLTSLGGQSLAGLLPLGWSPLAAAEIAVAGSSAPQPLAGAKLTFHVDANAINAATQTLSLVQYDSARDEWRVVSAVANVAPDGKATFDITSSGNYALVYSDKAAGLTAPPPARSGAALQGVVDPCIASAEICRLTSRSFTLNPRAVLPHEPSTATLITDGAKAYPSGTAVQAFIDEQLNLADGRVLVDPPFVTDLLVYRTLAGTEGIAEFHLAPTAQAQSVVLRDGVDRIRIVDYPGRIERGALLGAEGGRIPGDDVIAIDVPVGATTESLHASAASIDDLSQFGSIAGFRIAAAFTFSLTRAGDDQPQEGVSLGAPELLTPAKATVAIQSSILNPQSSIQVVVAEVLNTTEVRLVARMEPANALEVGGTRLFTTRPIVSTELPLDGIIRDGRYLVLTADNPIAYAFGQIRSANGIAIAGARVSSPPLGVRDITSADGVFVVPVPAQPAAPFSLLATSLATGDGSPFTATTSPAAGSAIDVGVLTLTAQPPIFDSITPPNGAELDASTVVVQAIFRNELDASSANALTLTNATTNTRVAGSAQLTGSNTIRFTPSQPLQPATRYIVTVGADVRSAKGASFGRTVTSQFTTRAVPQGNTAIRRERIRITLPDASGKSNISGAAGALPATFRALAVRRGRYFVEMYQTTVAADGSFSFDAGHRHASDRITTSDAVDLHVIDSISNATIAIIELTPFVSADGKGFLAPIDRATTFTSADGITVVVPSGAFDEPTMIRVEPQQRSAFDVVSSFDNDLRLSAGVKLDFAGIAKQRIEIDMPAPANADTSRSYFLGYLADSAAGVRVELVDLIRLANGRFTTIPSTNAASNVRAQSMIRATALTDPNIRHYLGGARRSGIYGTVDLVGSTGWTFLQGLKAGFDLINEHIHSIVTTVFTITENRGAALVPVPAGRQFDIIGVDINTGLEAFRRTYDPIAAGSPTNATPLPSPIDDDLGPYPVYVSPARVEVIDTIKDVTITSVRGIEVSVQNGSLRIKNTSDEKRWVTGINTARTTSTSEELDAGAIGTFGSAEAGERVLVILEEKNVDSESPLVVVFNRPLYVSGDANAYIHQQNLIRLWSGTSDITNQVTFELDSRGTRVELHLSGALQREKSFTVEVSKLLTAEESGQAGLKLLQRKVDGQEGAELPSSIRLRFSTRAPAGEVASTSLANGVIRDFALNGNVALVSALDGGVQAFDISDPAGLDRPPIGAMSDTANEHWAVATDRHGRVYTTGVTPMLTFVQSYRLEDFLPAQSSQTQEVTASDRISSAVMTWRLGYSSTLPLSTTTTVFTDLPEALPRKLQIAVSDDELETTIDALASSAPSPLSNGFVKFNAAPQFDSELPYQLQRITVENRTLKLRWSADAPRGGAAAINGIIGRPADRFVIVRNKLTYAVVSLFGFGIGVFDLNAIESNDNVVETAYTKLAEKVVLSRAEASIGEECVADPNDVPCPIRDLAFTPEAAIRPLGGDLIVYALESNRGLLDILVKPPQENPNPPPDFIPGRAVPSTGLALGAAPGTNHAYHHRLRTLRDLYFQQSGREPRARFTSISPYITFDANGERVEYALIAARDFGLNVVRLDGGALGAEALVDVVWIPAGAYSVRVMPNSDVAVVIDGKGRVLLIDLKRIDESQDVDESPALFPTALASINANGEPGEVGADDPRILWKSAEGLVKGTLPPLVDPDTGFVFTGDVNEKTMRAVSAIDPRLRAVIPEGSEVRSVVPLGVESPAHVTVPTAAFQLELVLPGAAAETLSAIGLPFAVESEDVAGAATAQTDEPLPKAHLRSTGERPTTFLLQRPLPEIAGDAQLAALRYQSGFNRFVSPWIVTLSDPRASKEWTGSRGDCVSCERPPSLQNDASAHELYTTGRLLSVRPENAMFGGTPYAYLSEHGRLVARIPTVKADTVRPRSVLVAAQNPPVAGGMLQETTYLHSGEVETSSLDLDAGGRAGWNVVIDRTYRSRTIGGSPFGVGWESSIFRRVRALPNADVEYRDGAGEIWTFKLQDGVYTAPQGLFLRLARTERGWSVVNQKLQITSFDDLGRLVSESDEFYDPRVTGSGNVVRYFYNDRGQLDRIVDPMQRATALRYNSDGLVEEIKDWRGRTVNYIYSGARLMEARLPDTPNTNNVRPAIRYTYQSAPGSYNNALELAANVETITDPVGPARVKFTYDAADANRDRVSKQEWGTGESATFTYASPTQVEVADVLGQVRKYTLTQNSTTDVLADRAHAREVREVGVPVFAGAAFGALPSVLDAGVPSVTPTDRTQTFDHAEGTLRTANLAGVSNTTLGYQKANGAPGLVVRSSTSDGMASTPITRTFHYQQGSGAFLDAIDANGKRVNTPEAHRYERDPAAENSSVTEQESFDPTGQLKEVTSSGGTDNESVGARSTIEYFPADDPTLHRRGMVRLVRSGEGSAAIETKYTYPDADTAIEIDARGVATRTTYDSWRRPVNVQVTKAGDPLVIDESFFYDAAGRIERTEQKKGSEVVTTSYTYDVMGRPKTTTRSGVAVEGGAVTTSTVYDLASRRIITTQPGGATTTTELDTLGRTSRVVTNTGSMAGASPIEQRYAYDIAGNRVYATDMFTASATAFDAHGRAVATKYSDGTISTTEYDDWGRPKRVKDVDAAQQTISDTSYDFTDAGTLKEVKSAVDTGVQRTTTFAWDGGGRTTSAATNGRASKSKFDSAGRAVRHAIGSGDVSALSEIFSATDVTSFDGALPATSSTTERGAASAVIAQLARNTTGDVTTQQVGTLEWKQELDALGNITKASVPGRPPAEYEVDSRGAVKKEILPGGDAENQFSYHPSGAQASYNDPTNEATNTLTDLIGRPLRSTYPDGTEERIEWEGTRIKRVTDRQGRAQVFTYNAKGQLTEIRDGAGIVLDMLAYDSAGRLTSWKNADSELTWSEFTLDGSPKKTAQKRFRDGSGLSSSPQVLDEFTQEHRWNEHGERTHWSMPSYAGLTLGAGWAKWIREERDAMGNLILLGKVDDPSSTSAVALLSAQYRNAGRPDHRTITTPAASIVRTYGYHPTTSLMNKLEVSIDGIVVAGSEVQYDGLQKSDARLLGVSGGERHTKWRYDDRSRVTSSVSGIRDANADPSASVPGRAREVLTAADFRTAQERVQQLSAATAAGDPPSKTISERAGGGHKIAELARGPKVYPFGYAGAEVVDDGRFTYEFDAKGRLIRATEKTVASHKRRVVYSYSGTGRLIGRRAEYTTAANPTPSDWRLEDRKQILDIDGLPAETTFVWDAISDQLITVAKAAGAGILKQIIHGGLSYDDPIETATIDPDDPATVNYLYPIYDEAGGGSLQAVVNKHGELVARNLSNDPFGGEDVELSGAAVDRITARAKKNDDGTLAEITIDLHTTEAIAPSTAATGSRLAALDAAGSTVRVSTTTPSLIDTHTIRWTLTPTDWTTLTTGATTLSIAATEHLRATAWSADVPVMPAPEWATATKPIFTTPALPIELRESLASLSTFITAIPPTTEQTTTLYQVESLPLLGTPPPPAPATLAARLHAHPFTEPVNGLNYVRARWYDPLTGSFLSPDPKGYVDSSNLYAFAGGDPVNRRDPTGEDAYDDKLQGYIRWYSTQQDAMWKQQQRLDEAYKHAVAARRDTGSIIADRNILETRRMTFGGSVENAATYIEYARARGNTRVLSMSFEQIHAEVVSDEAVRNVGTAIVGAFMPHAPTVRRTPRRSVTPVAPEQQTRRMVAKPVVAPSPGDWDFIGPIMPADRPPILGVKRPYNVAQRNPIPGYDNHHLNPPLGRSDANYATGPTIPVRNDNQGGTVPGGENWHTGRGGFQQTLNEHIRELGFTRAQWNNLPASVREMHLRRYYASLGIPYP